MSNDYLYRLYYVSMPAENFSQREIGNILSACEKKNPGRQITGLLFWGNGYFFQCLEGPRTQIYDAYMEICSDERHKNVMLLEYKEVGNRLFSSWSMKYLNLTGQVQQILKRNGIGKFNPYTFDGYAVNALVDALSHYKGANASVRRSPAKPAAKKPSSLFTRLMNAR